MVKDKMRIYNTKNTTKKRKMLRKPLTEAEKKLWERLRNKQFQGSKFFRQYGIGPYIADFYCPELKLAVEIDGAHHFSRDGREYDSEREKYFASLKIKTIRFSNDKIIADLENVLDALQKTSPSLIKEGERGSSKEEYSCLP